MASDLNSVDLRTLYSLAQWECYTHLPQADVMRTKPVPTCTVLKTVPDFKILQNNTCYSGGGHRNLRTVTK